MSVCVRTVFVFFVYIFVACSVVSVGAIAYLESLVSKMTCTTHRLGHKAYSLYDTDVVISGMTIIAVADCYSSAVIIRFCSNGLVSILNTANYLMSALLFQQLFGQSSSFYIFIATSYFCQVG